jgi:hemoglobin-like flavoprotein
LFSFKDSENLFSDQRLLDHGVTVVRTIGTAVAGLQNIQDLIPVLIDLGEIHAKKGVLPEHYPVVA